MLSNDYLMEEAEDSGLPTTKRRAILREYVQNIILNNVYKSREGRRMYFMGGTALRYCYRLPRFSEDLDFNAKKLPYRVFQKISENAVKSLEYEGFKAELTTDEREGLYTAKINLPDIMQQYNITDARGVDLMVKLEVNQPHWPLKTQPHVLSYYGFNYTTTVMAESNLITEKLLALLNRNRGRDIYDLLFMLKKKFPFDKNILKANGLEKDAEKLVTRRLENLGGKELERLAKQVQPFLFKEDDTELVKKAPEYAKKFLRNQ